jgi:hypothetical protein
LRGNPSIKKRALLPAGGGEVASESDGFVHLSAGDLLRAEQVREGSQYGELIREYIREGKIAAEEEDDCYVVCGEAGGGHCGWLVVVVGG